MQLPTIHALVVCTTNTEPTARRLLHGCDVDILTDWARFVSRAHAHAINVIILDGFEDHVAPSDILVLCHTLPRRSFIVFAPDGFLCSATDVDAAVDHTLSRDGLSSTLASRLLSCQYQLLRERLARFIGEGDHHLNRLRPPLVRLVSLESPPPSVTSYARTLGMSVGYWKRCSVMS